jgi:phage regulator Rha-like protein
MRVWIVGVSDCEGNSIKCICSTKEIAERELFKARDELIVEWKEMEKFTKDRNPNDNVYSNMIEALSSDNYEKWDNYPHDVPYLYSTEIVEK